MTRELRRRDAAMIASEVPPRTGVATGSSRSSATTRSRPRSARSARRALLEGVRNGDLDLVACTTILLGDYIPQARVFSVPFLFRDYAHARAVLDGPIG
jgi:Bacterial extracellular solute-binding protein, family 7